MRRNIFLVIVYAGMFSTLSACKDLPDGVISAPEIIVFASSSCAYASASSSVDATIKGETFRFDPSCTSSFDHHFRTKRGMKCEIHAGTCSSFGTSKSIDVRCADGTHGWASIACPEKK
jgi:hypothetical protein